MKPWLYVAAAVAIGILIGCEDDDVSYAQVGQLVPDKAVESFDSPGKDFSPRDFKGKVVLIDFWATWCGPCKQFMPVVHDLKNRYADKGLVVMSVTDEPRQAIVNFKKKQESGVPVYLDPYFVLHKAFQVEGIPQIAVVDRSGVVTYDGGADAKAVSDAVEKALG